MTFGKPGRPAEDRLLRQREIFEAVSPLILDYGARQFSMRESARAACLSVGGLYHYFPTKRELVLHGLDIEARSRLCADEGRRVRELSPCKPVDLIDVTVDALMRVVTFIRPSVLAALDLGGETRQTVLGGEWMQNASELANGFRPLLPGASDDERESLARSVRRLVLGSLIDRDVDVQMIRADLRALIAAQVEAQTRQAA